MDMAISGIFETVKRILRFGGQLDLLNGYDPFGRQLDLLSGYGALKNS